MSRYFFTSSLFHISLLALFFFSPWFRSAGPAIMIDGFEYMGGGGGGGNGKPASGGPKAEQMGQVVPQPVKVPIPAKPAPVQHATAAEETWKLKNVKEEKKLPPKEEKQIETPVNRGEKPQEEKTNIIRRGVDTTAKAGDGGFDFGSGEGTGGGNGKGVGIGFGPGEGEGFGGGFSSYLRILRQRIWSEWTQSAVYGSNQVCIVGLTVGQNGNVSDIKVEKPSGNSFYDSVAVRAVRNASPLPPLPSGFPKPEQRFRIQFRLLE